jgi:membrane-associated phospholipid phosphatase
MHARELIAIATLAVNPLSRPAGVLAQAEPALEPVASPSAQPLLSGRTATVAGLLLVTTLLSDQGLRSEMQEHRGSTTNSLADFGNAFGDPRYVVPVLGAGYLAGELAGSRDVKGVVLRTGAAVAVAGGVANALKYTIGRKRPSAVGDVDSDQFKPFSGRNSFPSGHASVAFAIATTIADETGDSWSDVALYVGATLTAFARVNDDRHWTSDVLVGGLIGHLSARWVSRRLGPVNVGPGMVQAAFHF